MKKILSSVRLWSVIAIGTALFSIAELASAAPDHTASPKKGESVTSDSSTEDSSQDSDSSSGSELWSANCGRCHNKVSPDKYSDAQWGVIAKHMRIRGNLTGQETRSILEFLRSAN